MMRRASSIRKASSLWPVPVNPLRTPRKPARYLPHAATSPTGDAVFDDTFYDILGVEPCADATTIKRGYYRLMKDCHPDRFSDSEATEWCKLVNEMYETLSDPVRRSIYDQLIGVVYSTMNPFRDDEADKNEVFVDEFACIGCRTCTCLCPETFEMEEVHGRARAVMQGVDADEDLQIAIDSCPVTCIHWVSVGQRRLLDQAMGRMGRVPVWALMSGSAANINVFVEASGIWDRQQAELQAERDVQAGAAFWVSMTGQGYDFRASGPRAGSGDSKEQGAGAGGGGSAAAGRGVAAGVVSLAGRASAAVGRWKQYQEVQRATDPRKALI